MEIWPFQISKLFNFSAIPLHDIPIGAWSGACLGCVTVLSNLRLKQLPDYEDWYMYSGVHTAYIQYTCVFCICRLYSAHYYTHTLTHSDTHTQGAGVDLGGCNPPNHSEQSALYIWLHDRLTKVVCRQRSVVYNRLIFIAQTMFRVNH